MRKLLVFFSLILPCVLAALRSSSVGTDYAVYLQPLYENALESDNFVSFLNSKWYSSWHYVYVKDWEIGFTSIMYLSARISHSMRFCAFVVEAFIIFPLYKAVKNYKKDAHDFVLSFFSFYFLFFNGSLNNMRQFIAMSFLLLAISFIISKNVNCYKALLYFLISVLFHSTAVVGLFFYGIYFFISGKLRERRYNLTKSLNPVKELKMYVIGFFLIILLFLFLRSSFLEPLMANYSWYLSGSFSFMPRQLVIRLPVFILYLICWKKKKDDAKYFYGAVFLINVILSQLAGMSSQTIRLTYYCSYLHVLSIPYFLNWSHNDFKKKIYRASWMAYCVFYWFYMYILSGTGETFPYKFMS